jgi:transcriptional regulator with XRE-family HTH domain
MKKISSRLKLVRGNLSQVGASRLIGICQQGWARYEKGGAYPGAEVIVQICSKFNVSADWLLGLSERRDGAVQTVTDPALEQKVADLEAENEKLKDELLRLKGENAGLNKALEMLAGRK